jgi:hypothetical protein
MPLILKDSEVERTYFEGVVEHLERRSRKGSLVWTVKSDAQLETVFKGVTFTLVAFPGKKRLSYSRIRGALYRSPFLESIRNLYNVVSSPPLPIRKPLE